MRVALVVTAVLVASGAVLSGWLLLSAEPPASPRTATTAAAPGPVPGATPEAGSEVLPPDEQAPPSDRLPAIAPATPRIAAPLPEPASAQGALVEGYPADLAAPLDGSDVLDSSLAVEGDVLQFTLIARSDASGSDIAAHYAGRWAALGMAPAPETGPATSYRDAFSSVTVAAEAPSGTGTVYTVYGVLRAG
ncbi:MULTISPECIES: hypothetical protein [Microbacterium]|uniref:Uncharacterized protein n=1 Tax=Microbacterium wangchenii TaxID=2541726 RepID=A0ABX5SRM0_9MICO|nr:MULTISPECIES: hypothetical protein [Microbacterium]MCK6068062.1 hypothetical protein [Microbacterium sp. EYE_512]QBR87808.1 hypothetical protein E4K62_03310 [Microbacterium wangchenii]TXK16101.1 hypothetical protein FVP99_11545 [Microbacterium wangchenii]